eukprot:5770797-Amphidinium_carterae.1
MGQATIESQHIKQVLEEMSIPEMDTDNVTMTINTDSSSGKAVASRLGLTQSQIETCPLKVPLHSRCDTTWRTHNQEDPNNTQPRRCTHQTPSSNNNSSITP